MTTASVVTLRKEKMQAHERFCPFVTKGIDTAIIGEK
jgi:hypothetical protein